MSETYKDLLLSFMDRDYVLHTKLSQIDPTDISKYLPVNTLYLGVGVMQQLQNTRINPAIVTDFFKRCQRFLQVGCSEIKKRFDFDDPLLCALDCFSPAVAMDPQARTIYPSLFPMLCTVPRLLDIEDTDRIQLIDDQWRQLAITDLSDSYKTMDVDAFWYNLSTVQDMSGKRLFADLATFALDVLIFPHSNASCERVFSKVNLIKTKPRNRLITATLNGLIQASECVSNGRGCPGFAPTKTMLRSMTSSNLYRSKASTSTAGDAATDSESDEEIEISN
uniref:HAT C-terminal dimerisation domain-containing protein n=1 Tax=Nothobranchius rachovii TaxID=451742 RepID=A0A1A8QLI1_9TELE